MFAPGYIKEGRLLQKGVRKFLRYKSDLISAERMTKIDAASAAFADALETRDKDKVERVAQELTRICERSVPEQRGSAWRENVEVIFVAIVIAVGIRAYFLQPFKIPTGSMQPTLNGVNGYDKSGEDEWKPPFVVKRWFEYVQKGRNYVNVVAEERDHVEWIYEKNRMKFFTFTIIECASGKKYSVYAPLTKAMTELNMGRTFGVLRQDRTQTHREMFRPSQPEIYPGQTLARGYVDTGDQVLVDKMSYHFRKPKRGEVFVFTTNDISGISTPAIYGSQHYIKRLGGVPGDMIELKQVIDKAGIPQLYGELSHNGKLAEEEGFRRVMSRNDEYRGYSFA